MISEYSPDKGPKRREVFCPSQPVNSKKTGMITDGYARLFEDAATVLYGYFAGLCHRSVKIRVS